MRSATHGHFVRIAGDDTDCLLGNAQNFGDDLGKDGLVPLPAGLSADGHFHRPVTVYNDLRELHRRADRRLNIRRVTDPPQFSPSDGIRLRSAKPGQSAVCNALSIQASNSPQS